MGFSNDPKDIDAVRHFRDAACVDGWRCDPTYKLESVDRACTLTRDGYTIMILTRVGDCGPKWRFEASVHVWGSDGLAIDPPETYDFAEIKRREGLCMDCHQFVEKTVRVGFAGRVCEACLPAAKKRDEYPGWCD